MNIKIDIFIKIALTILFFICLLDMPYGYYQMVRFLAMCGFAYLAFLSNISGNQNAMFIYIALAMLFQPIIKISLGREIWNIIDVIVGIGLLLSIYRERLKQS
jgi:hypothetical protein